jgi:hypothetical protein
MAIVDDEPAITSVLDEPGGPSLDLAGRFPAAQQAAVGELLTELRRACGSLVPVATGSGRGFAIASRSQWRCLRDVSSIELVGAVRRAARSRPDLVLPGDGVGVHRRIEALLDRAAE